MSYAKLVEGKVEFAPLNKGPILNYNQNTDMLLADGYKLFIKAEPEYGHLKYHIEYSETDSELREVIVYDETEEEYQERLKQEEAERIAMLNLTGADVERGIYKAKGLDFDDVITYLEAMPLSEEGTPQVDIKALKIELKANNFYRGNPYVEQIGKILGFTDEQLNKFFETGDYRELLTIENA